MEHEDIQKVMLKWEYLTDFFSMMNIHLITQITLSRRKLKATSLILLSFHKTSRNEGILMDNSINFAGYAFDHFIKQQSDAEMRQQYLVLQAIQSFKRFVCSNQQNNSNKIHKRFKGFFGIDISLLTACCLRNETKEEIIISSILRFYTVILFSNIFFRQ